MKPKFLTAVDAEAKELYILHRKFPAYLIQKFNGGNNLSKEFIHGWVDEVIKEIFLADLILLDQLKKIK